MRNRSFPLPKHGGIATVLLLVVLLVAIASGGYYYFRESSKASYAAETVQLATTTSQAILQLSERSSTSDLQRIQSQIAAYQTRRDADPSAIQTWTQQTQTIEAKLIARDELADQWQKRASEFSPDSTLAELEAFDAEIKAFTKTLDQSTRNRLLVAWSQRKNQIMADRQRISATIIAKTFPSGAKTYLDGKYIGLSSLGMQNVRGGKHQLSFEKEGYLPAQFDVLVTKSETIEPPVVELQLATHPVKVIVVGGKKKAKISISLEKTADDNDDIILYIDDQEGQEATFSKAPLGRIRLSVTADLRLAAEQVIDNKVGQDAPIQLNLDQ